MADRTPALNFLPPAYVALRRHRRWARLEVAAVVLLAVGLALGITRVRADLQTAKAELASIGLDRDAVDADLRKRDALVQLRDQWQRQDQLLSVAGTHIESSRILMALEQVVPSDTVLTDLAVELPGMNEGSGANSLAVASDSAPTTRPANSRLSSTPASSSALKVTVRGMAPGELSVGNLLTTLSKTPIFRHVNLTYAKDRDDPGVGRSVREFEVTFQIDLHPGSEIVSTGMETR